VNQTHPVARRHAQKVAFHVSLLTPIPVLLVTRAMFLLPITPLLHLDASPWRKLVLNSVPSATSMHHSPVLNVRKDTDSLRKPILAKRFYSVTLRAMTVM